MRKCSARLLVRLAARIVPAGFRDRFVEEWLAEIACEQDEARALRASAGAFRDAAAARRVFLDARGPNARGPDARGATIPAALRDVRFALRSYARRPLWTAVVVAMLAAGIGATTAVFSLFNAVLLRPLDYPRSSELVKIIGERVSTGETGNISPADFYDFEAASEAMSSLGAHGFIGFFTITGRGTGTGEPERVPGSNVTAGFFETLAVVPQLGRSFTDEDDEPGAPPTVLLTHGLWRRRYAADPEILGTRMEVNAVAHEIIGVLPSGYRHPEPNPEREPALYTLYQFERGGAFRSGRFLRAVGRLSPGRSVDEARAELSSVATRLESLHPDSNIDRGVDVIGLKDAVVRDARTGVVVLLGAVIGVLLIACSNIANLQLLNGASRGRELLIKTALGADRARLVQQLVTESLVLAGAGGALGLALAYWIRGTLSVRAIPRAEIIPFDGRVLVFALVACTAAAMLFGLAPALALSGRDPRRGGPRRAPRQFLVAVEVAVSLVLLVASGLLLTSLLRLERESPGFEPTRTMSMRVALPIARYEEGEQIPFYESLYARIAALPGVEAVGGINILPLSQGYSRDGFQIEDRVVPEGEKPAAEARSVAGDYFRAMGVPLLRGRLFDARDRDGSAGVALVSDAMAKRFWPGEDPIGKRITYNRGVPEELRRDVGGAGSRELIGIVGDVKHLGLDDAGVPMFYTPAAHQPSYHGMTLVIRTSGDPDTLVGTVRHELSLQDAAVPLFGIRSLDEIIDRTVDAPRFRAYLLGVFALLALGLAVVGVYAVVAVTVSERSRDIGIRLAIGARSQRIVSELVTESMRPVALGLVAGLAAALLVSRYFESLLFGVSGTSVLVYGAVAALLALAALVAAVVPTLRALRIDPARTLRTE